MTYSFFLIRKAKTHIRQYRRAFKIAEIYREKVFCGK